MELGNTSWFVTLVHLAIDEGCPEYIQSRHRENRGVHGRGFPRWPRLTATSQMLSHHFNAQSAAFVLVLYIVESSGRGLCSHTCAHTRGPFLPMFTGHPVRTSPALRGHEHGGWPEFLSARPDGSRARAWAQQPRGGRVLHLGDDFLQKLDKAADTWVLPKDVCPVCLCLKDQDSHLKPNWQLQNQ